MNNSIKKIALVLGTSFVLATQAFVAQAETTHGPSEFGKTTISELTSYGPAKLDGTIIQGKLDVMGPLSMRDAQANTLDVKGMAEIYNSEIKGKTTIYGLLQAEKTSFKGDLFSATSKLVLTDSMVNGNVSIEADDKTSIVRLNHSTIQGDLIFTENAGRVILSDDSKVTGKITNGSSEKE